MAGAAQPLLPGVAALHGRWLGEKPAIVAPDATLSWAQFDAQVNRVANGLIAAGCGRGERVGLVMDNGAAMACAIFGALRAGTIVAPLNTTISDVAIDGMLADAGVAAILVSAPHAARISAGRLAATKLALVERRAISGAGAAPEGWTDFETWLGAQSAESPRVPLSRDDDCSIIYSSGTTGLPKGIVHTHGARLDWSHDLAHALRYDSAARTLIATGLYSNITWAAMLSTVLLGGTLVIHPHFDAGRVLEAIGRERISHFAMVPVQYQRLLEHPGFSQADLTSLRATMSCGSALPERVKSALLQHLPCGVIELYGTTEGLITTLPPEDAVGRVASVGKPLPGEDLVILGDDDRILPRAAAGEIVARSRFMMRGYWNRPEATAQAFWRHPDGEPWLRSGDIGRLDEAGYLYITDRKKDVILSGGQNIYPADIEAILMTHEGVSDCAVFGIPSEAWGETPLAFVVLRAAAGIEAGALLDWVNARLGRQQRVHRIEFRPELPRNTNGKLLKRELRAPYWP